jgi:hypothetical protein
VRAGEFIAALLRRPLGPPAGRAPALLALAAGALGVVALGAAPPAPQAPPAPPPGAPSVVAPEPGVGVWVGPHTCGSALCHGAAVPRGVYPVRQDEYHVWSLEDPHARAGESLSTERARLIAANLGLGRPAHLEPSCLACHAPPPGGPAVVAFGVEDGVTCESCHGAAGGWLGGHDEEGWSHADSLAAGMADLRHPAARAATCLGCHHGAPGRRVDHRLYAAGHPQLPFELDNYAAAVSHWRARPEVDGVRSWAVGQVAALAAELGAISADARAGRWPELAYFACTDCHHPLGEERWRQAAEPVTGQPRWNTGRRLVLRHLVAAAAPGELAGLDAALAEVAAAIGRLGAAPGEVAQTAERAARAVERAAPAVAAARWDRRALLALLATLAADAPAVAAADYDAAQQVAFAVNSLASAALAVDPSLVATPLPGAVEAVYQGTFDPYRYDRARFTAALDWLARAVAAVRREGEAR